MHSRFMRPPEVARLQGVTRQHIYHEVKLGRWPPPVKIGRVASGWLESEVVAMRNAQLAGVPEEELKALVLDLVSKRTAEEVAS